MRRRDFIALAGALAAFPRVALGLPAGVPRLARHARGAQIAPRSVAAQAGANTPRLRELDFSPFRADLQRLTPERAQQIDAIVRGATVPGVVAALDRRALSSVELALYLLDRIRRYDERLRSTIELNPMVLEEARAADGLRQRRNPHGPLLGIPLSIKDNIETAAPMHTTGGAEILFDHVARQDADVVAKLRGAGAVILGKASLSELAGTVIATPGVNAVSGAGVNPYGDDYPVWGSSSGSAIATSAYLVMASVGTETSGSLMAPAAANGVVAMKPSLGLVSAAGLIPLIHYQDSAGPVARSVTDAAVLLGVIDDRDADYLAALDARALNGVKVGVLREDIAAMPEDAFGNALALARIDAGLKDANAVAEDIPHLTAPDLGAAIVLGFAVETMGYLSAAGAPVRSIADLQAYNQAMPARRIPFGQDYVDGNAIALDFILNDHGAHAADLGALLSSEALRDRAESRRVLDQAFADSGAAVLVSLSNLHSELYATAGYPAISVPLGLRQTDAPTGVTLIGKQNTDAGLLAYAYAFEQATRLRVQPTLR
jgi:amidase